jgi:hypothetical protein
MDTTKRKLVRSTEQLAGDDYDRCSAISGLYILSLGQLDNLNQYNVWHSSVLLWCIVKSPSAILSLSLSLSLSLWTGAFVDDASKHMMRFGVYSALNHTILAAGWMTFIFLRMVAPSLVIKTSPFSSQICVASSTSSFQSIHADDELDR